MTTPGVGAVGGRGAGREHRAAAPPECVDRAARLGEAALGVPGVVGDDDVERPTSAWCGGRSAARRGTRAASSTTGRRAGRRGDPARRRRSRGTSGSAPGCGRGRAGAARTSAPRARPAEPTPGVARPERAVTPPRNATGEVEPARASAEPDPAPAGPLAAQFREQPGGAVAHPVHHRRGVAADHQHAGRVFNPRSRPGLRIPESRARSRRLTRPGIRNPVGLSEACQKLIIARYDSSRRSISSRSVRWNRRRLKSSTLKLATTVP